MSELLSKDEIEEITRRSTAVPQSRWFKLRGIAHRLERTGGGYHLMVSRHHFREWLCGQAKSCAGSPNWASVR